MNTGRSVALKAFLKRSPCNIDSKYVWVCGYDHLGSSDFLEVPFLAFLPLHTEEKVCQWDPPHVTPRVNLCVHTNI